MKYIGDLEERSLRTNDSSMDVRVDNHISRLFNQNKCDILIKKKNFFPFRTEYRFLCDNKPLHYLPLIVLSSTEGKTKNHKEDTTCDCQRNLIF